MNLTKSASALAIIAALSTGFMATSAHADLPKQPVSVKVMDTDKNGKIEKAEYLAFMGKEFDRLAAGKGYCTFEEIAQGFDDMNKIYRNF